MDQLIPDGRLIQFELRGEGVPGVGHVGDNLTAGGRWQLENIVSHKRKEATVCVVSDIDERPGAGVGDGLQEGPISGEELHSVVGIVPNGNGALVR